MKWTGLMWIRHCYWHGNELAGSIKCSWEADCFFRSTQFREACQLRHCWMCLVNVTNVRCTDRGCTTEHPNIPTSLQSTWLLVWPVWCPRCSGHTKRVAFVLMNADSVSGDGKEQRDDTYISSRDRDRVTSVGRINVPVGRSRMDLRTCICSCSGL
jgi:hypothetical protein